MNGLINKFISFWMFILGVLIIGKIMGKAFGNDFMADTKSTIIVLAAAALVFIVWNVARTLGNRRREAKAYEEQQRKLAQRKGKGNKRR